MENKKQVIKNTFLNSFKTSILTINDGLGKHYLPRIQQKNKIHTIIKAFESLKISTKVDSFIAGYILIQAEVFHKSLARENHLFFKQVDINCYD